MLMIKSKDDPRYLDARSVDIERDVWGSYFHYLNFAKTAELDLRPCLNYTATVRATLASGQVIDSTEFPWPKKCIGVDYTAIPTTTATCGALPPGTLDFTLTPYANDGRKLTQMLFGTVTDDNRFDILNNWNNPAGPVTFAGHGRCC
ncbi:hypothetical protein LP420_39795 [Massilia sp. B-10]|nr:hypothetical protein LP420_39795 [Massilia sp. B-10]